MNPTSFQWSSCDGEPGKKRNSFVTESAILERPRARGCYEPSLPEVLTRRIFLKDLFADTVAILNSIASITYYGTLKGQISMYLSPEHPIIAIWSSRIQMAAASAKSVAVPSRALYFLWQFRGETVTILVLYLKLTKIVHQRRVLNNGESLQRHVKF